jgi:ATP-dependent exoDNAse (exonuclease V) alpha subunit
MLDADAPRGQTILVDEAGMISARGMERLIRRAGELDSRLLLVGDPKQLRAVEAGTPFAQMIESESIAHARIDEIQRQRDPRLREIAQSFSRGDARGAVRFAMDYATEVRVDGACAKPTRQERRAAIARATAETYLALSPEDRAKTLVLAGTNEVRRAVNEQIRAGIDAAQEQPRESVTFIALDKADLTREQATRAEQYADAMIVTVTEARGKERRRIAQYEVIGRDTEKNMLLLIDRETGATREFDPARERARGVYTQRDMDLAVGDRIMYREPVGRAKDPGGRVANGSAGTIVETDAVRRIAAVRLDNGRVREIDLRRAHAIDYAWARTVHSAQGATVDRAIVAGEASRVATAETAYVALSREREHLSIITDDKAKLAMSWSRYAEKQSAVEAAKNAARDFSRARLREMRRDLGRAGDLARARASEIERERERFFPAGI